LPIVIFEHLLDEILAKQVRPIIRIVGRVERIFKNEWLVIPKQLLTDKKSRADELGVMSFELMSYV